MKGIAHFMSGVAVASFCPWAVAAAQNGNPAFFIFGAVAGIFPDTIDFKFYRFFYPHDVYVELEPNQIDPQPIADAVAAAISEAADTGKAVRLKLSTIQLSADNWRQYRVKIDADAGEVRAQFGPVVSTGQVPLPSTLPDVRPVAVAKFSAPVSLPGESVYTVDVFDGPSFKFTGSAAHEKPVGLMRRLLVIGYWLFGKTDAGPDGSSVEPNNQQPITNNHLSENQGFAKGAVDVDFLPWHRNGSHSFIVGALWAGIASCWSWRAGVVVFGAYAVHIIEDQLGHMGSNLFFPFTKRRTSGLKIMHAGDVLPNFGTVWFCCLLIFWNMYAAIPDPLYHITFFRLILTGMIIPFAIFGAVHWMLIRADKDRPEYVVTEWSV